MARPLIGITGPRRKGKAPRFFTTLAIWLAGGRPVQLRPGEQRPWRELAGFVISGGHDINPVLYAAQPEVEPRYDEERDAFESEVIDYALAHRRPLLGICRGAQLLNIRRGGSLFQELRSQRQRTSNRWTVLPLKTLCCEPQTRLCQLMNKRRARINSLHNQGIKEVGEHLRVCGRDLDNIIQAVEDPDYCFLVGVQWHPEFLFAYPAQFRLFRALVRASQPT